MALDCSTFVALCLESRFQEIVLMEYGVLGFGQRNTTQGIRNLTIDWNPESKFHLQRFRNQWRGILLHGATSEFNEI